MSEINLYTTFVDLYPEANFNWDIENGEYLFKNLTSDVDVTESELQEKTVLLQGEYTEQEYSRNRASAYDSIGDQLDMMMKDKRDGTTTHQTACEAVKAQFPKPE